MFQNFLKKRNLFSSFFCRLCCIRPRRWFNPNETNKEELAIPILTEMRRRRKSRKIPACIFIFFLFGFIDAHYALDFFSTLRNFYFKMSFFFHSISVSTKWRSRQSFVQNFLFWSYSWDLEEEKEKLRVNGLQKLSVRHTVDVNTHTSPPLCHRYTFGNLPE